MDQPETNFISKTKINPCEACIAPCCKMVLIDYPPPSTFMDMDYIRFMLGFPSIRVILRKDGIWQVKIIEDCSYLEPDTNKCKVHYTERQPKTCSYYNPYNCWYKRNFLNNEAPEVLEFNSQQFEKLLSIIQFDEEDKISRIPKWEEIKGAIDTL